MIIDCIETYKSSHSHFFRLAFANFMDSTEKKCCLCGRVYQDLDEAIKANPIMTEDRKIACKECYDHRLHL